MSQSDTSYDLLKLLVANTKTVPNSSGLGVFYWEPEAFGGWQGYQLGAFDDSGKPTRALRAFQEASGTTSNAARTRSVTPWGFGRAEIVWQGGRSVPYQVVDLSGAVRERGTTIPGKTAGRDLPRGSYLVRTPAGSVLWTRF
jgi:hypothetical protein